MSPMYEHDCNTCRFVGQSADGKADLYVCESKLGTAYVARLSSIGSDYYSASDYIVPPGHEYLEQARMAANKVSV